MKSRIVGLLWVVVIATAGGIRADVTRPSVITFFVYQHQRDGAIIGRPGIAVSRLGRGSEKALGVTDAEGEVRVKTADVSEGDCVVLLFCDPASRDVCTAVRLDGGFLAGFAEYNVQLPPTEVVDRMRVGPRKH